MHRASKRGREEEEGRLEKFSAGIVLASFLLSSPLLSFLPSFLPLLKTPSRQSTTTTTTTKGTFPCCDLPDFAPRKFWSFQNWKRKHRGGGERRYTHFLPPAPSSMGEWRERESSRRPKEAFPDDNCLLQETLDSTLQEDDQVLSKVTIWSPGMPPKGGGRRRESGTISLSLYSSTPFPLPLLCAVGGGSFLQLAGTVDSILGLWQERKRGRRGRERERERGGGGKRKLEMGT